jgi:outer membrane lipoprotein
MSDEIANLAVLPASYENIRDKSQEYMGKTVMLGGIIGTVTNSEDGGQIEVVQYPLTNEGFPDESLGSAGRFLVTSPTLFEITAYPKGTPITVIGEVKAERHLKTQWETSRMPVVSMRKAHLWQSEEEKKQPFLIPGTNLVDPYYFGHDTPLPKRPLGIKTDLW